MDTPTEAAYDAEYAELMTDIKAGPLKPLAQYLAGKVRSSAYTLFK